MEPPASPAAPDVLDQVVIIGAGPAGLTAAHELTKRGRTATILEADTVVGGISRTVERDGWRFDIGGHRFFTKVADVERRWHEILPDDFIRRPRMSRIFYNGKFFDYPLKAGNALRNLGPIEAVACVASYVWARIRPPKDTSTFEGWTVARFGWRLYRTFFKTYTEKVWGVPANEITSDWAAQRIKNLSLGKAVWRSIFPGKGDRTDITSLIEEFEYPKLGPGQMWERCTEIVTAAGCEVQFDAAVARIRREGDRAVEVIAEDGRSFPATAVISSMPLGDLVLAMDPPAPSDVQAAAKALAHRDFLTVALVVPERFSFPDNWIYVHSPDVKVGRIQNFGSWSPYMVKDGRTCLGLEYFVFEGDELWSSPDDELVALATRELGVLGLVEPEHVETGYVVRMPKAYPTYDETFAANVETCRAWLASDAVNVHPVGRNGMHRYNNQDHSMVTAELTVDNLFGARHDVWAVNVEEEYHEEVTSSADAGPSGTGRSAPVFPRK
jgi:protoporphyrinogen oxidase